MANADEQETQGMARLSWASVAAALVAMGGLYISGGYHGLPIMGLALLGIYITDFRIPKHPLVVWPMRILLFSVIILTSYQAKSRGTMWLYDPRYINVFGYLCAAEMVIQAWQRRTVDLPRGEILLLSALIIAAAAQTFEQRYMRFVAPAYAMFLAFSFRDFRWRSWAGQAVVSGGVAMRRRLLALALALVVGLGTAMGLRAYGEKVTIHPLSRVFKTGSSLPTIGMSGSARLSLMNNVQPSPTRVLRIQGKWSGGHLRGLSFDSYGGETWRLALAERQFDPVGSEQLQSRVEGRRLRITRLVDDQNLLYVPLNAMGIVPAPESQTEWDREQGRIIRSSLESGLQYAYDVVLGAEEHQGPVCAPLSDELRERCLAVPEEIDASVRKLARRIAGSGSPRERVWAVVNYLQANHRYSLRMSPGDGEPVCDFILNRKAGHCQFFASSAVLMLRCVGVPSRFVTGYYVHETAGNDQMVVRQWDAHAWAECWIDGVGWITVDATPASGLPDEAFAGVGLWQRVKERLEDWWSMFRRWVLGLDWKRAAVLCGVCIVLFMMGRWIWEWWRRRPRRVLVGACIYPQGELAGVARGFERLLRRCGIPCTVDRTWREHLQAIVRERGREPEMLDIRQLHAFVAEYEELRFGKPMDSAAAERLLSRLRDLERSRRVR